MRVIFRVIARACQVRARRLRRRARAMDLRAEKFFRKSKGQG